MRFPTRATKIHAAAIIVLLLSGVTAVALTGPRTASRGSAFDLAAYVPGVTSPADSLGSAPLTQPGAPKALGPGGLLATDESGIAAQGATASSASASSSSSSGSSWFAQKYPAQYDAYIDPSIPATNFWALLIGINDYAGSTRDNVGSYQDARDLRKHLLRLGWQSDHVVLLGNRDATASHIIQAIRWLAAKTDAASSVVFHYSGHEKPLKTSSDGDNESRDVALWVADNKLIVDGILGREMNRVQASRMWIDLAVCRAGGFSDAGMVKSGRILTFSSPVHELSFEDPGLHHSVFGWYMISEGMRQWLGDSNGDHIVTVEEAYKYARPLVVDRTDDRQHPRVTDKLKGQFNLIPPKPAPPPEPPSSGGSGGGSDCGLIFVCTAAGSERYYV